MWKLVLGVAVSRSPGYMFCTQDCCDQNKWGLWELQRLKNVFPEKWSVDYLKELAFLNSDIIKGKLELITCE